MTVKKTPQGSNGGWDLANKLLTAFLTISVGGILALGWNAAQVPALQEEVESLNDEISHLRGRLDKHDLQLQSLDIRMTNHHRRGGVTPNE